MRKVKLTAIALCIIIVAGVLAGCGSSAIPKPTPSSDKEVTPVEVTGSCEMKVEGSTITVTGKTDFIDTTVITISVAAQSGMVIDTTDVTQYEDGVVEATFQITDDKYNESVKAITGFLTVSPNKQNSNVLDKYGKKFEHISSDTIWNKDGNIVTFSSESYKFN